jgi:hypothetical protein
MPEQAAIDRAHKDASEGKSPSTQAGEFVREEFHHFRKGKHGAHSSRQAIAIGLSQARRAGVELPPPKRGRTSGKVRRQAQRDSAKGHDGQIAVSRKRSRAVTKALPQEGRRAASRSAISGWSPDAARHRTSRERTAAARRAVRIKTPAALAAAGQKVARTRQTHEMS